MARLAPGSRLIDLGCGEAALFASLPQGLGYAGADLNIASLRRARQAWPEANFARADLASLPFKSLSFQAGIMQAVLTVLPSRASRLAVLAEARRVLDGPLYLADFLQKWDDPYYRTRYETGLAETGELGGFVVRDGEARLYAARHFTRDEILEMLEKTGFSPDAVREFPAKTRSGKDITALGVVAG